MSTELSKENVLIFHVNASVHIWAPGCLLLTSALLLFAGQAAAADAQVTDPESPQEQSETTQPSDSERVPQFGGPSSVGGELNFAEEPREPYFRFDGLQRGLAPWFTWKRGLREKKGFSFGVFYSALYQSASESLGEDEAASGIFQLPISWTLTGGDSGNTGTIVFKAEHRHAYTDIPPQDLGFAIGAVGITGTQFSDIGGAITNFYWQQKLQGGRMSFVAGRVDPTDYLDVYGMINPQTSFSNLSFSTNPTIAIPNQGLGGAFGAMLNDRTYLVTGLSDANALPTETSFDTFFDNREYFKHLEIGRVSSFDRRYFDNTHVMVWHADRRADGGVSEGWGATFSHARFINDRLMPFIRVGYSDGGGGALLEKMISAGLGLYRKSHDLMGFGVSWGEPSEDSFSPGLDDQITLELFYRMTTSENFAVTPDLQVIFNPALNPGEDSILVGGIRVRWTL